MAYGITQLTQSPFALSSLGLVFGALLASACSPLAPSMRKTDGRYEAHGLQGESSSGTPSAPLPQPSPVPQEVATSKKRTLIPLQFEESAFELLTHGETLCLTLSQAEEENLFPEDTGVLDLVMSVGDAESDIENRETVGQLEFKRVRDGECAEHSPNDDERYYEVTSKLPLMEIQSAPEQNFFIQLKGSEIVASSL